MIPQTAKVISLKAMTDAMLASSSIPEADYPEWNPATAYAASDRCIRASVHQVFRRVAPGTTPTAPELDTVNWLSIAPTNRWAMFDDVIGTSTVGTSEITAVMRPGSISGLVLMEAFGSTATITMKDAPGGAIVYSKSVKIDSSDIRSIYDWFYKPLVRNANIVISDLPFHFASCELTISITGPGEVSVGVCKVGEVIGLGTTEAGATSGIIDYSNIKADTFGRYAIVEGAFSKKMSIKVLIDHAEYDRISRALAKLRAKFSAWIATEESGFEALAVYGLCESFAIEVPYVTEHLCSLNVKGTI